MYKIAPDKWEYNQYWHYLYYYPDGTDRFGYRRECVYMNSYFDYLQLYFWSRARKKELEKEKTNEKTGKLYECFLHDAIGTNNKEEKPSEEELGDQVMKAALTNLDSHNQMIYRYGTMWALHPDDYLNYEHDNT